jgi:hypothetical protein
MALIGDRQHRREELQRLRTKPPAVPAIGSHPEFPQEFVLTAAEAQHQRSGLHGFRADPGQQESGDGAERQTESRVGDDRQRHRATRPFKAEHPGVTMGQGGLDQSLPHEGERSGIDLGIVEVGILADEPAGARCRDHRHAPFRRFRAALAGADRIDEDMSGMLAGHTAACSTAALARTTEKRPVGDVSEAGASDFRRFQEVA